MAKETKKTKRPTAQKREIQNNKRRLENRIVRSQVRTAVRNLEEAIEKKDSSLSQQHLTTIYSLMDKSVKKGVFKLNKGSRTKARLAAKVQALQKA